MFSNIYFFGQKLPIGTYCIEYKLKDFSTCLTFNSNKEFFFTSSGDLGVLEYGSGNYDIKNGFLILDYCNTKLGSFSGYHQYTNWTNDRDNIEIQISVNDRTGEILPNVGISFPREKTSEITNIKGMLIVEFKKSTEICEIIISALGYEQYSFQIQKNLNYQINIVLSEDKDSEGIPIKGQIDNFELLEFKNDILKLKDKDGIFRIWKKIN